MVCTTCERAVTELDVFPGGLCLACYAETPAANAPLTADDIVAMWGGPARRRRR